MKKNFILLIASNLMLLSCQNEEKVSEGSLLELLQVEKTTTSFTEQFSMFGIEKINIEISNSMDYHFSIISNENIQIFSTNGTLLNFNGESFSFEKNRFYNLKNSNVFITKIKNKLYLNYNNKLIEISKVKNLDNDLLVLFHVFNELTTFEEKINTEEVLARACSVFNQVIIAGIGETPGGAIADFEHNLCRAYMNGTLDRCWNIDRRPVLGTFLFGIFDRASMAFCCDGTGPGGATGCW